MYIGYTGDNSIFHSLYCIPFIRPQLRPFISPKQIGRFCLLKNVAILGLGAQDGSLGRPWMHVLPQTQNLPRKQFLLKNWGLNSFCIIKGRGTTLRAAGEPDRVPVGSPLQTQWPAADPMTCGRNGYHWAVPVQISPALGHNKNQKQQWFKGRQLDYEWRKSFINPRMSAKQWGNCWNSLWSWGCWW